LTFEVTWFESLHCWLGPGSVATGTGTDGVGGAFDLDGLDVGLVAVTRSGPVAAPVAATAGAWAAATRTRPAPQTAIRRISAASMSRHISRIRKRT
jgi:hypothetical protein